LRKAILPRNLIEIGKTIDCKLEQELKHDSPTEMIDSDILTELKLKQQ
jgi:hypothetical protein